MGKIKRVSLKIVKGILICVTVIFALTVILGIGTYLYNKASLKKEAKLIQHLGVIVQIIILIIMAVIIIISLWKLTPYKHFCVETVELGFEVRSLVDEYKKSFEHTFLLGIIIGAICLLAAVIPMMIVSVFNRDNNAAIIIAACIMMLIFAFGISCIVYVVTINQGYRRILKLK